MHTSARNRFVSIAALLFTVLLASGFLLWKQQLQADAKAAAASSGFAYAVLTQIHSPPDLLTGRVVDANTRKPISQFRLMLRSWDAPEGATSETSTAKTIGPLPSGGRDGVFRIRGVPKGEWRMTIFAMDHEPFEARLVIADGETRTTTPLPLRPGRSITGRVSDASDGSGISGATVMLRDSARAGAHWRTPRTAHTMGDGWFIIDGVPLGALQIDVQANGYVPRRTDLPARSSPAQSVEVSLSPADSPAS